MKKALFLFAAIVLLCSCERRTKGFKYLDYGNIVEIDGCQYLEVENAYTTANNYSYTITHKGDCKNPIHQCKCK